MAVNQYRKPDLGGLLPDRAEVKAAKGRLSKEECTWLWQAAYRCEVPDDPGLARLLAGVAWQQLTTMAWAWTAFAAVAFVGFSLLAVFSPIATGLSGLGPFLALAVAQLFVARRLAGTIALNVARHAPRP